MCFLAWQRRIALMQSIFSNALSRAVAKHIGLSATRQETLSWLTLLIMQHGTINILMISVTWNGMGIPLLWMMLPTAGNSNTSERTELLDRLRAVFPGMKI